MKIERFYFGGRYTEDGADYLYTELDLAFTAVVNPQALATKGPGAIAVNAAGPFLEDAPAQGNGDALGISLANLRAMLLTPRQNLTFSINGNTVVNISGPDSRNGPLPQRDTYVRWIMGTNTALVYFHVKAWAPDLLPFSPETGKATAPRVVLANRYRVTSTMDENWYSRRHIAGQMIVDVRQMRNLAILTPDAFRAAAFLQIPLGFKRENVQVTVSSDNTTLDYSYIDQETPLALGLRSLATEIHGSVSVGIKSPLANLAGITDMAVRAAAMAGLAAKNNSTFGNALRGLGWGGLLGGLERIGGGDLGQGIADVGAFLSGLGLPKIVGMGTVRIKGQRYASKAALAALGVNILIDRFPNNFDSFGAPSGAPRIGTISVTQDLEERMVEVSISFIPTYEAQIAASGDMALTAVGLANMSSDIVSQGQPGMIPQPDAGVSNPLVGSNPGINVAPPNSNGTRGTWNFASLVVSLLSTPGQLPVNAAADPAPLQDLGSFI